MDGAISIQSISHCLLLEWCVLSDMLLSCPTRKTCRTRPKRFLISHEVCYISLKNPYWHCFTLAKYFYFHKSFCLGIFLLLRMNHVKWNLPLEKNCLMYYLLWQVKNPCQQETNINRRKLRKTCVLYDTLISMVSYEKPNMHNQAVNILTQILVFKLVEIYI